MKDAIVSWILFIVVMCFIIDAVGTSEKSLGERGCKTQVNYFGVVSRYTCDGRTEYHIH